MRSDQRDRDPAVRNRGFSSADPQTKLRPDTISRSRRFGFSACWAGLWPSGSCAVSRPSVGCRHIVRGRGLSLAACVVLFALVIFAVLRLTILHARHLGRRAGRLRSAMSFADTARPHLAYRQSVLAMLLPFILIVCADCRARMARRRQRVTSVPALGLWRQRICRSAGISDGDMLVIVSARLFMRIGDRVKRDAGKRRANESAAVPDIFRIAAGRAGTVGWARTTDLLFHRQAL